LCVMRNHTGHEVDVGIAVRLIYPQEPLLGRWLVNGLHIAAAGLGVAHRHVVNASRIRHDGDQPCCDSPRKCPSHKLPSRVRPEWYVIPSNFESGSEFMFGASMNASDLSDGEVTRNRSGNQTGMLIESDSLNRGSIRFNDRACQAKIGPH